MNETVKNTGLFAIVAVLSLLTGVTPKLELRALTLRWG